MTRCDCFGLAFLAFINAIVMMAGAFNAPTFAARAICVGLTAVLVLVCAFSWCFATEEPR